MTHTLPLFIHTAEQIVAWRAGQGINARAFLQDVYRVVQQLPDHAFAVNLCEDRYHFLVSFAAILVKGQTNLLPPNHAAHTLRDVMELYPDCYCLTDSPEQYQSMEKVVSLVLPQTKVPQSETSTTAFAIPAIDGAQLAAVAFTSGSTGKPAANLKTWSQLLEGTRRIQERLEYHCATTAEANTDPSKHPYNILATVPPQHMYGLENSIMFPLVSGSSIHAGRPLFPQDISEALTAMPAPRLLITTPVHLKSCVGSAVHLPEINAVISATAPLDRDLAAAAERAFHTRVLEIYGCTECGSLAMRRTTQELDWQLLDTFHMECDEDTQACRVSAPHLSEQVKLHDHIEQSTPDRFHLRGRKADMINIAGKRASLADLNIKLNQIDGVTDGIILFPDDDAHTVTRLLAIVCAPGVSEQYILNELKTRIDPAFLPRPIFKVDSLPREATGKLLKSSVNKLLDQLRAKARAGSEAR